MIVNKACAQATKNAQRVFQVLVDLHDCSLIPASITVVWSRKNGDHILVVAPIVALHDQLMCAGHQCQTIVVIELLRNVLAKRVPESKRKTEV
jgi:hypothetical protein